VATHAGAATAWPALLANIVALSLLSPDAREVPSQISAHPPARTVRGDT